MNIILHITHRPDWEASFGKGYYQPSSLNSDGFIHCSTIEQTADTANQYFHNQQDLLLICIDTNKTEPAVRYEAPAGEDDKRTESLFPHIYGPLNVSAVIRVIEFVPDKNGKFVLPVEISQFKQ